MKKAILVAAAATAFLCVQADTSSALEFQRIGKLGIGGAGVATSTDSLAGYWNPAGLAFHQKSFSGQLGVGAGVNVSKGLADSVDKIDKMDLDGLKSLSTDNAASTVAAADAAAKAAEFVGIALDIQKNGGTLSIAPTQVFSFQTGSVGIGLFGLSEVGAYISNVDTINILPDTYVSGPLPTVVELGNSIGALTSGTPSVGSYTPTFFSSSQQSTITSALQAAGASALQADAIMKKFDQTLAAGNTTGQTPAQLAAAVASIAQTYQQATSAPNAAALSI